MRFLANPALGGDSPQVFPRDVIAESRLFSRSIYSRNTRRHCALSFASLLNTAIINAAADRSTRTGGREVIKSR